MKTLAIRLEDEQHARLTILARIRNVSVTDAIRAAIETHIAALSKDPEVSARAEALVAEIERDANDQRAALQALIGGTERPAPRGRAKS